MADLLNIAASSFSAYAWSSCNDSVEDNYLLLNSAFLVQVPFEEQEEDFFGPNFPEQQRRLHAGISPQGNGYAQRLLHHRRLSDILHTATVSLPVTARRKSQSLLDAVLAFAPHQIGIGIVVDEEAEASLVLTAYWPSGTLHSEHFFHFPVDDPADTAVSFYASPPVLLAVPARQWGWHGPTEEFASILGSQLRSGRFPLKRNW